ncbi:hypothetical protein DRQ53_06425 [bacterium]|nr:MAG: hypothetical protein DRQ32_01040 [bacterium]RKZ16408.1 MAG: hypothetical protein DRQ53_06425 [bacterium]
MLVCMVVIGGNLVFPGLLRAQPDASISTSPTDSLRIAWNMAARGESSIAAFGIVARQLQELQDSGTEAVAPGAVAEAFRVLGMVSRHGGDISSANVFSQAAWLLADALYPPAAPERAGFLLEHALSSRLSGRPGARSAAMTLIEEGIGFAQGDSTDSQVYADLLQARANLNRSSGNREQVRAQYAAALDLRLRDDDAHRLDAVENECWLAVAVMYAGEMASAERIFLHCEKELIGLGLASHPLMSVVLSHLAVIAEHRQELQLAIDFTCRADSSLTQARSQILPGFSQRRLESALLYSLTDLHLQEAEPRQAWAAFIESHRQSGGQARALGQARRFNPEFVARLRKEMRASAGMFREVHAALAALREQSTTQAACDQAISTLVRYAQQKSVTFLLQDQLRREYGSGEVAQPSVTQLQAGIDSSQAVVGYVWSYDRTAGHTENWSRVMHAVVLRRNREPVWVRLATPGPSGTSHWRRYTAFMRTASEWPTRLPDDPGLQEVLHGLYGDFFEPLEPFLHGAREVLLLSAPPLPGFPFPALVDDAGTALIERFAFRHLLSSDDITHAGSKQPLVGEPSLVLGDPLYDVAATSGAGSKVSASSTTDPTLSQALTTYANTVLPRSVIAGVLEDGEAGLSQLPGLPSSGWEARGIAGMTTPVNLVTGAAATEQELRRALGRDAEQQYRWVHLASHALVHPALPERSALALSPRDGEGLLYVEEIGFGWTLNCDLITLSGCQTGGGPLSWTAGPLGFVQALHSAGARNLLLSTGKVDDIATALLMERFYANVSGQSSPRVDPAAGAPLSYSEALADAQCWLRDLQAPDGQRPFAHPVYWAAFRLHGQGM